MELLADQIKVGDKVTLNRRSMGIASLTIVTVVKITPKKKDITVKTGTDTTMTFDAYGSSKSASTYSTGCVWLSLPTDEDYKMIRENAIIRKCGKMFNEMLEAKKITAEMAEKIFVILANADKEGEKEKEL